jgi:MarR family transcriptional regulator for hemolysin
MDPSTGYEVVETARLMRRAFNRRLTALGRTRAQWGVLARLKRSGGGLRQVELAEALDVEPITLCRMIDRLEEAGLVERRRDKTDRRAWRIYLTDAAKPVVDELSLIGAAFEADMINGFSEADRTALGALLGRLRDNLARMEASRASHMDKAS